MPQRESESTSPCCPLRLGSASRPTADRPDGRSGQLHWASLVMLLNYSRRSYVVIYASTNCAAFRLGVAGDLHIRSTFFVIVLTAGSQSRLHSFTLVSCLIRVLSFFWVLLFHVSLLTPCSLPVCTYCPVLSRKSTTTNRIKFNLVELFTSGVTRGKDHPGWHYLGRWHPKKSVFFAAEFTKNTGETITWKADRVGVVRMTKKVITFFREK